MSVVGRQLLGSLLWSLVSKYEVAEVTAKLKLPDLLRCEITTLILGFYFLLEGSFSALTAQPVSVCV